MGITSKQKKFIGHCIAGVNPEDAAIRAGYKKTFIQATVRRLLDCKDIKSAIDAGEQEEIEQPKKVGRPSKFGSIDIEQVKKLAKKGFTDRELADFFGVTERTWHNWKKNESFFHSLKESKELADREVEKALFERACGYKHPDEKILVAGGDVRVVKTMKYYPPDPTAAIFWLKNRKPQDWRDKVEPYDGEASQEPVSIKINVKDCSSPDRKRDEAN